MTNDYKLGLVVMKLLAEGYLLVDPQDDPDHIAFIDPDGKVKILDKEKS